MLHNLVNSDWFIFAVSIISILGFIVTVYSLRKSKSLSSNRDSHNSKNQSQIAIGSNNTQAGRDIKKG